MPITSIGSYDPTTEEFLINWEQADAELAPGQITLAGNYARTAFNSDRTALLAAIDHVPALATAARFAAADRDNVKALLITRAKQFRRAVLSKITDPTYLTHLSAAPNFSSDLSKFCDPLHTMNAIWERINQHATALGLTGELTLQNGYGAGDFEQNISDLAGLANAAYKAEGNVDFARSTRNRLMEAIYERMKQYRAGAEADLPPTSPALENLPRLSPKRGTTPKALVITGEWNAQTLMAELGWEASKAPDLTKIQIRGCTGGTYKADEEEIVADLPFSATSWTGDWGLTAPGSIASFKAYLMNSHGNENGGKAVTIVRPLVE